MAQFDISQYETVEERHARALAEYPDLRCVVVNHTTDNDRAAGVWVVEARVYLNTGDQAADLPKAVDWAFEMDGVGSPANRAAALENASTSALGRALRWALGGSKGASQAEMAKVQRVAEAPVPKDLDARLKACESQAELDDLYAQALAEGWWTPSVQAKFKKRKAELK